MFAHASPRYILVPLSKPAADSRLLAPAAVLGLRNIYEPGFDLIKAGVILMELTDGNTEQFELALDDSGPDRSRPMTAMDTLNNRFGKGSLA